MALVVSIGLNIAALRPKARPNFEYFPNMVRTERYNAFEENPNFSDGMTLRAPVPGTIPRGWQPLPDTNPFGLPIAPPLNAARSSTTNFCAPCHGSDAKGVGPVVKHGFPPPPPLTRGHDPGQDRRAALRRSDQRREHHAGIRTTAVARGSMESDPSRQVVSTTDSAMNIEVPQIKLAGAERLALIALAVIGAITAAVGKRFAPDRLWASVLLVGYYIVGVGLAGLCFVAIHYTTGASWSVAIRRVAEALAGTLLLGLVLLAIVFIVRPQLYPWMSTTLNTLGSPDDPALAFKRFWLSRPFFLARAATYAVIWSVFALAIRRCSRKQDQDGDRRWTRANARLSAAFLVVFAVTFTLASVDWVMSLEPMWYSTIFGIYNFAGLFQSGLAAIILAALWLERRGPLRNVLNEEHLHDLGKLLFAFSVFWVYIWFSQYMLIWYTNIPEETTYFVRRLHGGWFCVVSRQRHLQLARSFRDAAATRREAPAAKHWASWRRWCLWVAGSTSIS